MAYELMEAGQLRKYLQIQGLSKDRLNNSKDTTIQ